MDYAWKKSPYVLELCSFQSNDSNKWCPKVLVKDLVSHIEAPILWDVELDSEKDANEYAEDKVFEYLKFNLYKSQNN